MKICQVHTPCIDEKTILVELTRVGVCGTDLQIIKGLRDALDVILGHEGCGKVIAVGDNVNQFTLGDIVTFLPHTSSNPDKILGHNIDGLFQRKRLFTKEEISSGLVIKADNDVSKDLLAITEPLAAVIYSNNLIRKMIYPKSIAIFGAGQIGILYSLYLRTLFSDLRIFLVHPNINRLNWAIKKNIIERESALIFSEDISKRILELTNKKGVDGVVICTTRQSSGLALEEGMKIVSDEGIIDLFSGFSSNYFIKNLPDFCLNDIREKNICGEPNIGYVCRKKIKNRHIYFTGHRGISIAHMNCAIELLKRYPDVFKKVISHIVSLKNAVDILNRFRIDGKREINGEEWVKLIMDFEN